MEEQALLAAIMENPNDDAPRLIYADWLEERGDVRAELIRVQCERAKIDDRDPRCIELEYRERSLLAKHRNAWAKPVRTWSRNTEIHRGFVERIALPAKTFVENAEAILMAAPVRQVKWTKVKDHVAAVAQCPQLGRLASLSVRDGQLGLARLKTLLASPWLSGLKGLDVSFNGLSVSAIRELVACQSLGRIQSLGLDSCNLAGQGLEVLLASNLVQGIRELELRSNNLDDDDARRLAESSALGELRELALDFNRGLTAKGVRALLQSDRLGPLRRLSLRECGLGDEIQAFEGAAARHDLVSLNLEWCRMETDGARRLASCPALQGLVELHLKLAVIGNTGLSALLEKGGMRHLRTLRLPHNRLDHAAVEMLAAWNGARNLTSLDLSNNSIGNRGAAVLANDEAFGNLNVLELQYAEINDRGARALAKSTTLNRLTELRLSTTTRVVHRDEVPKLSADVKKLLVNRFGKHVCHFAD